MVAQGHDDEVLEAWPKDAAEVAAGNEGSELAWPLASSGEGAYEPEESGCWDSVFMLQFRMFCCFGKFLGSWTCVLLR